MLCVVTNMHLNVVCKDKKNFCNSQAIGHFFLFFCISTALFHLTHKVGGTYVIAMPKSQKVLAWYLLLDEQTLNKTT